LGVCNNGAIWIPLMTRRIREMIETSLEGQEITLISLNLTLKEGRIHISGEAKKDPGSAKFEMDAIPIFRQRPPLPHEIPENMPEELVFQITNVSVDIDLPWWASFFQVLFGILTYGVAALVSESLISSFRNQAIRHINSVGGFDISERNHVFTISGDTNNISTIMRIELFHCHPYGLFSMVSLTHLFPAPRIIGNTLLDIEELVRGTPTSLRLQLPVNVHEDDPQLKTRWTLRRTDNNSIIRNIDSSLQMIFELTPSDALSFLNAPILKLNCRVYRTLGDEITDLSNLYTTISLSDRVDKSHPYFYWSHWVYTNNVRVEQNGTKTIIGFVLKRRISRIHRTDLPHRCRMASKYSISYPLGFYNIKKTPKEEALSNQIKDTTFIKYLDQLPFPQSELSLRTQLAYNRDKVCDYCFFGGPDKNEPVNLPE